MLARAFTSGMYGRILEEKAMADSSKRSELQALAEEAVRLQLEHRSRLKDQALLNLLSKSTSKGQRAVSTKDAKLPRSTEDQELIAEVMERFGYSEEEAIKRLTLLGGL
jgi:hypothetical protein